MMTKMITIRITKFLLRNPNIVCFGFRSSDFIVVEAGET